MSISVICLPKMPQFNHYLFEKQKRITLCVCVKSKQKTGKIGDLLNPSDFEFSKENLRFFVIRLMF